MAITVTKQFRDTTSSKIREAYKIAMNSASSGTVTTGLRRIENIQISNSSSATAVYATPVNTTNPATVTVADATTTDTLYLIVEGV